jgi:hypothetical protein
MSTTPVPTQAMSSPKLDSAELNAEKPVTVTEALERLALSREHLRTAMLPVPKAARGRGRGPTALAANLLDKAQAMPGVSFFTDTVRAWWEKHPLHTASVVAAEASRKFAAPLAQRNPMGLILGAVAVGAVLALVRPWRWMLRPALFAGLVPALVSRAVKELPVDSLIRMFGNATERSLAKRPGVFPTAPASEVLATAKPTTASTAASGSHAPTSPVAATPAAPVTPRGSAVSSSSLASTAQ